MCQRERRLARHHQHRVDHTHISRAQGVETENRAGHEDDARTRPLGEIKDIGMLNQRGCIHRYDRSTPLDRRRHSVKEHLGDRAINDYIGHIGYPFERNGINARTEKLKIVSRAIKVGGGNAHQAKPLHTLVKMATDQATD